MARLVGSLERSQAQTNAQGFLEWRAGSTAPTEFNEGPFRSSLLPDFLVRGHASVISFVELALESHR